MINGQGQMSERRRERREEEEIEPESHSYFGRESGKVLQGA